MENELQTTLNNILNDKNTNLKPENLKQGISCLGVDGVAKIPIPIYATNDYSIKDINLPHYGKAINLIYHINNFYIILSHDSPSSTTYTYIDVYTKENDTFVHKYNYSVNNGYANMFPFASKDDTIYFHYYSDGYTSLRKLDFSSKSVSLVPFGEKMQESEVRAIVNQKLIIGRNYTMYVDLDTETSSVVRNPEVNKTVKYCGDYFVTAEKSLWKFNIDTTSWINLGTLDSITNDSSICFTKDGTKVFMNGNLYTATDGTIGELIKENIYNFENTNNYGSQKYLRQLNDKYFGLVDWNCKKIYTLYEFDNELNTLTSVGNIDSDITLETLDISKTNSSTKVLSFYEFINGNVQIGVTYDNVDLYFQKNSIATSSDNVLLGTILYNKNYNKVVGTMPNNGNAVITPTTLEQIKDKGYYNSLKINPVTSAIDPNIIPENIKQGVRILGVDGNLAGGIDTSDATATAGDIVSGKTAYAKGQKITGGLQDSFPDEQITVVNEEPDMTPYPTYTHSVGSEYIEIRINSDKIYRKGLKLDLNSNGQLAEVIGLTADKIKSGETILGITGTYTGGV